MIRFFLDVLLLLIVTSFIVYKDAMTPYQKNQCAADLKKIRELGNVARERPV